MLQAMFAKTDAKTPPTGRTRGGKSAKTESARPLRGLVICPTRELAVQVAEEGRRLAQSSHVRIGAVYGKVGMRPQAEMIAAGVDILAGTPGRLRELMEAQALTLGRVRRVVIDEADRMMDMGFRPQVEGILRALPPERQMALFTATMPAPVESLVRLFLTEPVRIEIGKHTTPARHVRQSVMLVRHREKVPLLLHLLGEGDGAERKRGVLVYCRTRRRVGWVGKALLRHGFQVGMIHGDRTQPQRLRSLEQFANGELDVVVATDVAARGLHIERVRTVVNYDLPLAAEEYVHRVGRAGHGGGFGESFSFVSPDERDDWRRIARIAHVEARPEMVPGFEPPKESKAESAKARAAAQAGDADDGAAKQRRSKRGGGRDDRASDRRSRQSARKSGLKRRSSASRPVRKGEKPGGGVRKNPRGS
jgi:ATP-dependent RNA helicase RhlE